MVKCMDTSPIFLILLAKQSPSASIITSTRCRRKKNYGKIDLLSKPTLKTTIFEMLTVVSIGIYYNVLKLSVSDIIVSQKDSNGDRKPQFFEQDYNFTHSLCAKIHLWANIQPEQAIGDYSN